MNDRYAALDGNEAGRGVDHALVARRATNRAGLEHAVALEEAAALHEQMLIERNDLKEVFRAGVYTVAARGAECGIDDRKSDVVHANRAERAGDCAITESETAPRAALSPRGDGRGRAATLQPSVVSLLNRYVDSAGAEQARHALVRLARINAQVVRDRRDPIRVSHVARRRLDLPRHGKLGERAAAW